MGLTTDILHIILKIHTKHPELRVGQIIANAVRRLDGRTDCDPYYITDKQLLAGLETIYEEEK